MISENRFDSPCFCSGQRQILLPAILLITYLEDGADVDFVGVGETQKGRIGRALLQASHSSLHSGVLIEVRALSRQV